MANIQGLLPRSNKSKISFLIELAKLEEYAMIALTESHLNNNINITEIGIENYTTFRADRDNRSHGGVITYIRNDIATSVKELLIYSNGTVEIIAVHIKKWATVHANIYCPPKLCKGYIY